MVGHPLRCFRQLRQAGSTRQDVEVGRNGGCQPSTYGKVRPQGRQRRLHAAALEDGPPLRAMPGQSRLHRGTERRWRPSSKPARGASCERSRPWPRPRRAGRWRGILLRTDRPVVRWRLGRSVPSPALPPPPETARTRESSTREARERSTREARERSTREEGVRVSPRHGREMTADQVRGHANAHLPRDGHRGRLGPYLRAGQAAFALG